MELSVVNQQPIEKKVLTSDGSLEVQEIFPTIQGEGPYVGHPAVFVRLAGCNLQCKLCDTDYTSKRRTYSVSHLLREFPLRHLPSHKVLVVITGGEPFRQPLGGFIGTLLSEGYKVQIETNGTLYDAGLDRPWNGYHAVTIVCSPKTPSLSKELESNIDYLKYVVQAGKVDLEDGLPTSSLGYEGKPARPSKEMRSLKGIYVQPCDEKNPVVNEANTQAAITSCMKFGYILCTQIHKIVGLP